MRDPAAFGLWLKQQRKALDLTQEELAAQVGCAVETIRKLEAGGRRPSKEMARRLANVLMSGPHERQQFIQRARGLGTDEPLSQAGSVPFHNVPVQREPLIGREHEIASLRALLVRDEIGLVTLSGPGGVGKTRLALAVAAALDSECVGDVCFVELAALNDSGLIASTVAHTLGLTETHEQSVVESLLAYLAPRRLLLVLDNVEHLVAAAPLIADLLKAAPGLKILATSRALLHLSGEYEFPVPPLALPDLQSIPPPVDLARSPAVELFVTRARAVRPNFTLTSENAAAVAAICAQLDGLPLAIGLAAARIKLFSPQALLARLDQRLTWLTGRTQDAPARQQTLRATIDWSYTLLTPRVQRLFAHLGVFVGGWTVEACEAVCNVDGEMGVEILDALQLLIDNSLVQAAPEGTGEPRFMMLETIREYAWERLEKSGELPLLRARHARLMLEVAAQTASAAHSPQQTARFDRCSHEWGNIRAALMWSLEDGELAIGQQLVILLHSYWSMRGHFHEGRGWADRLLAQTLDSTLVRAKILYVAGDLAYRQGAYQRAQICLEESLALARQFDEQLAIACALVGLAELTRIRGDYLLARRMADESVTLYRRLADSYGIASALNVLGAILRDQGRYTDARSVFEESLTLYRVLGDEQGIGHILYRIGIVAYYLGDYEAERSYYQESLNVRRRINDRWGMAYSLMSLGLIAADAQDYAAAALSYNESMALFRRLGDSGGVALVLRYLGRLARQQDRPQEAMAFAQEALALFRRMDNPQGIALALCTMGHAAREQEQIERAIELFAESLSYYRSTTALDIASCLAGLADVATKQGRLERAAQLIGSVERVLAERSVQFTGPDQVEYARTFALVRQQLDEERFTAAAQIGKAQSLEQMISAAIDQQRS